MPRLPRPKRCWECESEFLTRNPKQKFCSPTCSNRSKKTATPRHQRSCPKQRFWKKVKKTRRGCWNWAGCKLNGYGRFRERPNKSMVPAHRYSWSLHFGEIPQGLWVLHKCDNPSCVNPAHLFLGTHQDNMDDMYSKGRNPNRKGESHPSNRLTEKDVKEIRAKYKRESYGKSNKRSLAVEYGVTPSHIVGIVKRKSWNHV